jgi:hypothetical protein
MSGTGLSSPRPDEKIAAPWDDQLDDRIAEILDELLDERRAARRPGRPARVSGFVSLVLAGTALGVLLGRSQQSWAIWPVAALTCAAATWVAIISRS